MGKNSSKVKESAETVAARNISEKQWAEVQEKYNPMTVQWMNRGTDKSLGREGEMSGIQGSVMSKYSRAIDDLVQGGAVGKGLNPGSGAVIDRVGQGFREAGAQLGEEKINSDINREQRRRATVIDASSMGQGIESDTISNFNSLGNAEARKQQAYNQSRQFVPNAIGSIVGMGAGLAVGNGGFNSGGTPGKIVTSGSAVNYQPKYNNYGGSILS